MALVRMIMRQELDHQACALHNYHCTMNFVLASCSCVACVVVALLQLPMVQWCSICFGVLFRSFVEHTDDLADSESSSILECRFFQG